MDLLNSVYAFMWEGLTPQVAYGVSSRLVAAVCIVVFGSWVPQVNATMNYYAMIGFQVASFSS